MLTPKHFETATRQAPTNPVTWTGLAVSQLLSGHGSEIDATLDAAAKAIPDNTGLATLKAQSNLLRESASDPGLLAVVLEIIRNPHDSDAGLELLRLAVDIRQSKDREQYAVRLQQLIDREPTFVP